MISNSERTASAQEIERLSRLVAIVESTDDAIISGTPDGLIASWNPAAERMFGYRADEAIEAGVVAAQRAMPRIEKFLERADHDARGLESDLQSMLLVAEATR